MRAVTCWLQQGPFESMQTRTYCCRHSSTMAHWSGGALQSTARFRQENLPVFRLVAERRVNPTTAALRVIRRLPSDTQLLQRQSIASWSYQTKEDLCRHKSSISVLRFNFRPTAHLAILLPSNFFFFFFFFFLPLTSTSNRESKSPFSHLVEY